MTYEDSIKSEIANTVNDPDKGRVYLPKLKEKELLDLLVRLAIKAKSIKSNHLSRHWVLLDTGKVLQSLYSMNLHRYALDEGLSREDMEAFEKQFKDKLFEDFLHFTRTVLTIHEMRKSSEEKTQNDDKSSK